MFRQLDGKYQIECDGECGEVINTGLRSFHQARNVSTVEGWEASPDIPGNAVEIKLGCVANLLA